MADGDSTREHGLPCAYWWASMEGSARLYVRYGWVATVSPCEVRIAADPPLYPATRGPCLSVEHGRCIVEKILMVRLCCGPPERREARERIRQARIRRKIPPPHVALHEDDDWDGKLSGRGSRA